MKKKKTKKTGGSTCEHVVNHGEDVLHSGGIAQTLQQIHEELYVRLPVLWENESRNEIVP